MHAVICMCQWHLPISCWPLKDLLSALLSGLHHRRISSAPAVQAAHAPLWHSSQSQCGKTVGILRVGRPARAHIFYHTWARIRDGRDGPGVWHQRRGGQGAHLHSAGSGQTRTCAPQGAGHHHLSAGPHYLPEHLHHLHLHLDVPLLSLCCFTVDSASQWIIHQTLCLGHIGPCNDTLIHKIRWTWLVSGSLEDV